MQDGDPKHIGPYRVIGLLGAGGMGRVYLGHRDDGVTAAVKVINEELAQDAAFRERFRREVVATKAVTGRYVAAVIDYDIEGEQPWLATEYVPAPSLHTVIVKRGPLDAASVRTAGARLAEALAAIHAAGLVHRDVKPGNILISDEGPRLIDFGIARGAAVTTLTQTGAQLGTPQYMAPEQLRGRSRVGPAADVFALGLVLAFAVTGEHPFGQDDSYGIGFRIVYEDPQLDGVPGELATIIGRCLAKQPEDRPTPEQLAAALRGEAELGPATRPETPPRGVAAAGAEADEGEEERGAGTEPADRAGAVVAVVTDTAAPAGGAAPADGGDAPDTEGGAGGGTTARPGPLPAGYGNGREPERGPRRRVLAASAAAGAVALVVLLAVALDDGGGHAAAQGPGSQGTPRSSASSGSTPPATGGTPSGTPSGGSGSPSPSHPSASAGAPGKSAGATPPGSSAGSTGGSTGGSPNGSSGGSSGGSAGGGTAGSTTPTHSSAPTPPPPAAGRPPGNMPGFKYTYNEYCFGACSMPLTVSWSAESGATSYDIHYTNSNGSVNTIYSTGGTSYVIDGPYSGDNICVSVRAANSYGASAWTASYCGAVPY